MSWIDNESKAKSIRYLKTWHKYTDSKFLILVQYDIEFSED